MVSGFEFEAAERAARRMIRAELNVLLRRRRRKEDHERQRWGCFIPILNALGLLKIPPEKFSQGRPGSWRQFGFVNGVDFAEVIQFAQEKMFHTCDHI